jgi:hypothetical protein
MVTVSAPEPKPEAAVDVRALKLKAKRFGITHDEIAAEAGVTRPLVVNVFAGRNTSRNVVEATVRLIREARRQRARRKLR